MLPKSMNSAQSGMVLATGLILLLVMTIIGVTAIGSSTMQEKMASNTARRSLVFECAERALREGELVVEASSFDELKAIAVNRYIDDPTDILPDPANLDNATWAAQQTSSTLTDFDDPCVDANISTNYALYYWGEYVPPGSSEGSGSGDDASSKAGQVADGYGSAGGAGAGTGSSPIGFGYYYVFAKAELSEGQAVVLQSTFFKRSDGS